PRAATADRGGLALSPAPGRGADAAPPPGRPTARRDRGRVARTAAAVRALGAPGRPPRQAPHHRRGRRRSRAGLLRVGDRPTARLTRPFEAPVTAGARPTGPAIAL